MQLNVFSTDSQKSGFRLQYLQVLNWGTFDQDIYTIRPEGETSLLTGANASGKTTIVDALLTLMVPEKRYRFYNQSSGSKKKDDRTEESYVMGGFGHTNSEEAGTARTQYLRPEKEKAYSILLVNFANEEEQSVTLFQVRYFQSGELRKFFGISHKSLTIEDDFKPFDLAGNWKKTLDHRYNKGSRRQVEWFDGAASYARRMVEVMGMRSTQALQLFNHTVGIKVLDNLDQFIRANMLEPRNMEEEYLDLKRQLATLLEARRNMEKAEAQIELLKPLIAQHDHATGLRNSIQHTKAKLDTAALWKGFTRHRLLHDAIAAGKQQLQEIDAQIIEFEIGIERLLEEERAVQNEIDGNRAGQRLRELETKKTEQQALFNKAQKGLEQLKGWSQSAGIDWTEATLTQQAYNQLKREAGTKIEEIGAEKQGNGQEEFDAKNAMNAAQKAVAALEQQLNSMQHNRNNLDYRLTDVRKRICNDLKIDTAELPFAAELMRLREDESDWEPAIEKLLSGFSRRLLVPEKHYKRVTRYVNTNDLKTRLVYEQVQENALIQYAQPGTVPDKLEFHPDHELSSWAEQAIIQRFPFVCLYDEKGIERCDRAITINGLIKDGRRHEKDDRSFRNDASTHVLGWDNERKKAALLALWSDHKETIRRKEEIVARCRNRENRFTHQFHSCRQIMDHAGFSDLDAVSANKAIKKLDEQILQLQQSNQALNALKLQLDEHSARRMNATREKEQLIGTKGAMHQRLEQLSASLRSLEPLLAQLQEEDKDQLLEFQQTHSTLLANIDLEHIDELYASFTSNLSEELERQKEQLATEERRIATQINRIKNPVALITKFPDWPADVQHLPDDPKYVSEYAEWLERLSTENLPKYRRDFENFINTTITHKVAGLKETLDSWEREIERHIDRLNESLGAINFNRHPDTYIQLGRRKMPAGTDVREFRQQLVEALPQSANWQQESFEAKAAHFTEKVQPLIDKLDGEEYRRRMLDVRNWFEFWADEYYRKDKSPKKTFRQMGQLSGGEKAQLTYTILCSAIAYQFGITQEGKASRSLRFIAVDESFSNQDEEKSTYLMELCRELHLQLLVVTPSDKIQIVQDFIAHVHLVQRIANRNSTLYNMTIKELKEQMADQNVAADALALA